MSFLYHPIPTSIDTVTCDSVVQTIDIKRPLTLTDIIDNPKYKHLFQGVGKFKIKPVEITLKEGVIPYQSPPRRVPVALQDPFVEELGRIECQGTITKLDKSVVPEWLNSFVITHRQGSPNLPLRICLDLTPLNDAIVQPIKRSTVILLMRFLTNELMQPTTLGLTQPKVSFTYP